MSMLAIAATGGYHAIVRSMNERGVMESVSSLLRSAKDRADVDQRHVSVYYYNRLLKKPSEDGTDAGIAAGVIVAVRRYGRISAVRGNFLYDEFADLDQCYEAYDNEASLRRRRGFRLYRFGNQNGMEYSTVADATWYANEKAAEPIYLPSLGAPTNSEMAAYYRLGGDANWKAGDAYGMEFVELQLPDNYIVDLSIPSSVDQKGSTGNIQYEPNGVKGAKEEGGSITIRLAVPNQSGTPVAGRILGKATSRGG